jgi:exodeoxyribonuclease V alpha subunit
MVPFSEKAIVGHPTILQGQRFSRWFSSQMTTTPGQLDTTYFTEIDRHFADFLLRLEARNIRQLWLAAALTSHYTHEGHVCLDLATVAGKPLVEEETDGATLLPELDEWGRTLRQCTMVGRPGDFRPLILDLSNRLYLYRYWEYENRLANFLKERAARPAANVDAALLRAGLERLFPLVPAANPDWQRVAATLAVLRNLCVITGGPGTGKTSTIVRILGLLLQQSLARRPAVALAAPTGKAAARMKEAIKEAKGHLNLPDVVRELIPEEAFTLHRLLGIQPGSNSRRYHKDNPLPYDIIVVDEASMIDLPLMAKLIEAIPPNAQLLLLGDRDQLASVEPGAVFGDICFAAQQAGFSAGFMKLVEAYPSTKGGPVANAVRKQPASGGDELDEWNQVVCPGSGENSQGGQTEEHDDNDELPGTRCGQMCDTLVVLRESYRFGEDSGIGRLSRAISSDNYQEVRRLLTTEQLPDLRWQPIGTSLQLQAQIERWVLEAYSGFLKADDPEEALARLAESRVLCALRKGPFGVTAVNQLAEAAFSRKGLIRRRGTWYAGQPILINRNDYQLRLFNGDVGIILQDPGLGELRAFFPAETGFRKVVPTKLPDHETVYATTVHKAQGSEFDRVLLLVPNQSSDILTRELVYTAITRARRQVEIWGNLEVLMESITKRVWRNSGLRDALAEDRGH